MMLAYAADDEKINYSGYCGRKFGFEHPET